MTCFLSAFAKIILGKPKPSHLAPALAQNSSGMRIYRFAGATYTDTDTDILCVQNIRKHVFEQPFLYFFKEIS